MGTPHRLDIRIYYEDTDFSGVVYHASYLRFLERGRTELLRDLGISQATLFGPGEAAAPLAFAVTRMEIDFRRAAKMDDLILVETTIAAIGGASMRMRQRISREGQVLVEAGVKIAAIRGGRAARLPPGLATKLAAVCRSDPAIEGSVVPVSTILTATED